MKKIIIITVTCLMAMFAKAQVINSSDILKNYQNAVNTIQNEYFYNSEMENGKIINLYVYRSDNTGSSSIRPTLKYHYEYDEADRLVSRTTSKWDGAIMKWVVDNCLNYAYNSNGYSVEMCKWNEMTKQFVKPSEKKIYSISTDHDIASYTVPE